MTQKQTNKPGIPEKSLLRGATQAISKQVVFFADDWKTKGSKREAAQRVARVEKSRLQYRDVINPMVGPKGPKKNIGEVTHWLADGRRIRTLVEVLDKDEISAITRA